MSPPDLSQSQAFDYSIRPAEPGDEHALFELIGELARYERLERAVTGSAEALREHLFREPSRVQALVAVAAGKALGYALFFETYSTFLTKPGLYLEDLFVLEGHRGRGIGRALLSEVRRVAEARGAARLEWAVLDWNQNAIQFYEKFGARLLPDWRVCRIEIVETRPDP